METLELELVEVASGLRFPEGPIAMDDGSVLLTEIARGTLTRVDPATGETTVVAETGGGPNGAAIGPDGAAYVTNNGGCFDWLDLGGLTFPGSPPPAAWPGHGSIQRVDLATGEVTELYTSCGEHPLRAPNDIVFDRDGSGSFWFTDHGVRLERASDRTGLYHAAADGSSITEVVFPLDAPNGVGLSPDGTTVYVAETHTSRVWAWTITAPGQLGDQRLLHVKGGPQFLDSLAVDAEGWVSVATLGGEGSGITSISPDGARVELVAVDDPLTTNICFGGDDHRSAYITSSGHGRLLRASWPRPGLALPHSA